MPPSFATLLELLYEKTGSILESRLVSNLIKKKKKNRNKTNHILQIAHLLYSQHTTSNYFWPFPKKIKPTLKGQGFATGQGY